MNELKSLHKRIIKKNKPPVFQYLLRDQIISFKVVEGLASNSYYRRSYAQLLVKLENQVGQKLKRYKVYILD